MGGFDPKPAAILFDLDGTLIDSVPIFLKVAEAMFSETGLPQPPREAVHSWLKLGEPNWPDLIPAGMPGRQEDIKEALMKAGRRASARLFAEELKLLPGVESLLALLAKEGIRCAVVTTGSSRFMGPKMALLKKRGLSGLLDPVITREDAPRVKPAPDPLLKCCRIMGLLPWQCVYVGDADVDIQAGRAAGMKTAAVLTGICDRESLAVQKPDLILESLAELERFLREAA